MKQVQAGETERYSHIVERVQQPIYVYCCRMLESEQEAEDAAQDILIKAYHAIGRYRPTVSFQSWLYKIAYHHCLNLLRRRRLQLHVQRWLRTPPAVESAEEAYTRHIFGEPLASALDSLNAADRALLILHIFEERTYAEIGQITGKSPEAVRKKMIRMKAKLKQAIEQWEGEERWMHPSLARTKN